MYHTQNVLFENSQFSSQFADIPRHRPPIPSLFTATGDREDSVPDNENNNINITSSSAPQISSYDCPPLSPIFPSLDNDQGPASASPAAMFLSAFSPSSSVSAAPLPDDEGEQVDGYKLGSIIGYGGFSTIRRAFSPSGGTVAVKIVRRSDLASQANSPQACARLDNEASIWKSLSHEHILPLFHHVHTEYADFFFMLICPAGTLYDILKRDGRPALPHDDARTMFRQVVRGVRYLHEQMGLVHADLKLENVLVDDMGVCRISDFGMTRSMNEEDDDDESATPLPDPYSTPSYHPIMDPARSLRASSSLRTRGSLKVPAHVSFMHHHRSRPRRRESTPVSSTQAHPQTAHVHAVYEFPPGSLPYAAPELLRTPDDENPYRPHPAQDVWALGVILYALLTGGLPFVDSFEPRLTMKILHGAFEMPATVGRGAELVLRGCLEASVNQRWTIAAVDEISWSVGWGSDADDWSSATAECELDRIVHETRIRKQWPVPCSASYSPSILPVHDVASEDAVPELEDDAEPPRRTLARSTSSRSRSTGTGTFSPFTTAWSEIEMASVAPPELTLPGTPGRSFLELPRGRRAAKDSDDSGRWRSSLGAAHSTSPSAAPISLASAERQQGGIDLWPPHALGLALSSRTPTRPRPMRADSQPPPRHSAAPWAVSSVCVSPALSVAHSTPHADGGFVLRSGVASVRSRSVGRA